MPDASELTATIWFRSPKDSGVHTELIKVDPSVRSGHTIIQRDKDGDNCIILYGGANQAITKDYVDKVLTHFEAGDFLILQNEINELAYIVEKAAERGLQVVLNPSPYERNYHRPGSFKSILSDPQRDRSFSDLGCGRRYRSGSAFRRADGKNSRQ